MNAHVRHTVKIATLGLVYKGSENCMLFFPSCSFTPDLQIAVAPPVLVAKTDFTVLRSLLGSAVSMLSFDFCSSAEF